MLTDSLESYSRIVGNLDPLSPEESERLAWLAKSGAREARRELIERHLWVVVASAQYFTVPFDLALGAKLVGAGNRALVRAATAYRPWCDGGFAEFAISEIMAAMREASAAAA